jgi:hypothetical protein
MDRWLDDAPALVYVNFSIWVVVNNTGGLIAWTDDPTEVNWLSRWILKYEKHYTEVEMGGAVTVKQPGSKEHETSPVSLDRGGVRESVRQRTPVRRQLIGEQIRGERVFQVRLFKTQEEAETWTRAAVGRRFRSTKIGSALWIRALHEELRAAQRDGFAEGSGQQTGNLSSQAERRARELSLNRLAVLDLPP